MGHTRIDNDCISFFEPEIHDDDYNKPDNAVKVNKNFRELSEKAKKISERIKWVYVDYYLFHSMKRGISYKTDKGYQSENSLLILTPLNITSNIETHELNVKIFSLLNFIAFFGFSEERRKELIYYARLALQAIKEENTDALDKLLREAERCKQELSSDPRISFKLKKKRK